MKKLRQILLLSILLLTLPALSISAQEDWEVPDEVVATEAAVAVNPDAKYLAGAVTMEGDKVVFSTTIDAPGLTAKQIYDKLLPLMRRMTKASNQYESSRIAIEDSVAHSVVGIYNERIVFKSSALVLDYTRMNYHLSAECSDGKALIKMQHISYLYDEERDPQRYTAEEWITDQYAVNKKNTKLYRNPGKFRRRTIDRKDYLFNRIAKELE